MSPSQEAADSRRRPWEPYVDERPQIYRFHHQLRGGHVHVRIFAGRNPYGLGLTGTCVFRPDEWDGLRYLIQRGVNDLLTEDYIAEFVAEKCAACESTGSQP